MAIKYIQGHTRSLSRKVGADYEPVVCLTNTAYSSAMNMIERISVCTQGQAESSPSTISRSLSFSGLVVDTTLVGGTTAGETIEDLLTAQETSRTTGIADKWMLNGGDDGVAKYFDAYLSDASDDYPAEGDATFSGSLTINGMPSTTEPVA